MANFLVGFDRLIFASLCAILLTGCSAGGDSKRVDMFLGDRATRVVAAPDRVDVFRITTSRELPDAKEKFASFPLIAVGKPQDMAYAVRLANILRDDGTYVWESAKGCTFDPGVGYRVWRGSESIVVLLCFHCDEVAIINDETTPEKMNIRSDDPARPALVKLARQAFADDAEIQALKE